MYHIIKILLRVDILSVLMNGSWAESPGVGSEVEKKQKVLNILEVKDLDGNRD